MATTTLISIRKSKGKTVNQCISDSLNYIMNPNKTDNGKLVTTYACDPNTAVAEFSLSKRIYHDITGRKQRNNIVMYQIRQSFKPDEVTPEQAQKIAYDLAMSFTKGNYAFVAATHVDKDHIHTHINFNSTHLNCSKKFNNFLKTGRALARISDKLCLENGLSIIETPKKSDTKYSTWLGETPLTFKDKLQLAIDEALAQNPKTFEEFLQIMQSKNFEVKQGKYIAFKSKEQQKFIRCKTLGEDYFEEKIKSVINGESTHNPKQKAKVKRQQKINLLVDIQSKLNDGKGSGYEQWAKIYNLKQMAQTINFLQENKLLEYDKLVSTSNELKKDFNEINGKIKKTENRMTEIKTLQNHIYNYIKTRDTYVEYNQIFKSEPTLLNTQKKIKAKAEEYYNAHEGDLILHNAAKAHFDALGLKKLPTIKSLQKEYAELLASKNSDYKSYKTAKKEMQDILRAKQNVEHILQLNKEQNTKNQTQEL